MRISSVALVACACACAARSPELSSPERVKRAAAIEAPAAEDWLPEDAAAGVGDEELARLLRDYWAFTLQEYPVWATKLGVRRFDERLGDGSHRAELARRQRTREFHARAKELGARELSEPDRITLELFELKLATEIESEQCEFHLWSLSPRSNPVTYLNTLHEHHIIETPEHARSFVARYQKFSQVLDDEIENLQLGAKRGLFANRRSAELVLEMVERQLAQPFSEWPIAQALDKPRPSFSQTERERFASGVERAVSERIRPALTRYRDLLAREIVPRARGADAEGIGALPRGGACYAALIRSHTTLPLSPKEVHATGLAEIERIDREMRELGKKLFGTDELAKILERLRTDPKLHFQNEREIVTAAETALARAKAAIPRWFGTLPKADCVVREIPAYEAPYTTIAYYREPHPDGSKPGEYMVNVHAPATRPRFEAEVLAFHESIPGHHLQIAISQERPALAAFRKHEGMTAFVEGWALYTERLADEMGLYSSDLDRMGMLSFDAWRAARLVVDTGIHDQGFTRQRAEQFMLEHTALSPDNIKNEVDRYIVWPGQALAYKTGQLAIVRLRQRAQAELGSRFELSAFHDAVLEQGAVSLPVLESQIERFIAARRAAD